MQLGDNRARFCFDGCQERVCDALVGLRRVLAASYLTDPGP
jgi:hypothetical protein